MAFFNELCKLHSIHWNIASFLFMTADIYGNFKVKASFKTLEPSLDKKGVSS